MDEPFASVDQWAGQRFDAVVIGAGPSGSIAAHGLARNGAKVLLVEKREFPRWKVCGACLNGHALGVLREAGLAAIPARLGAVRLDELEVRSRGRSTRIAVPGGVAVSRSRFDQELVNAATDRGVRFVSGIKASVGPAARDCRSVALEGRGDRFIVEARVVVLAAGLANRCLARDEPHLTRTAAGSRIGAGCCVEDTALVPDHYRPHTIHMAVGTGGYVGMVRVEDGSLNVAAAFDPALVRRTGGLAEAAARLLAEAGFEEIAALARVRWQGTPALTRMTRPLAGERLFLVGDAAGYVEPFTGEGMAWGMAAGVGVVPLALGGIHQWDPRLETDWNAIYQKAVGRRQGVCRAIAFASRRPWLAHSALFVAARAPGMARRVVRFLNAPPSQLEMS